MAKGIGLIGNFRGKVGNMVGYNLKDSNNKQTQGVRVYQPVVKNPKTYGQAEQRAKLAPINATYRALKAIIDRGQEGKAYGNKSRLAWLSAAMKAFNGGWFEKGAAISAPALVPLTKGSLPNVSGVNDNEGQFRINITDVPASGANTLGLLTGCILAANPTLKDGDQITVVSVTPDSTSLSVEITSLTLDASSNDPVEQAPIEGDISYVFASHDEDAAAYAVILSREGDSGQHLRSTSALIATSEYPASTQGAAAKEAAIKSYMAAGANTDWAEESLQ